MNSRGAIFIVLLFALGCSKPVKPTTIILLRHAEKATDGTEDPDLKPEGVKRAEHLAQMLKDTQIDGIYATDFKRTRQTVQPLASAKQLEIQSYEPFKNDEIEEMLAKHGGETIVVCGHTNNIPWTANLLTGKDDFKDYEETQYGIFLIVTVVDKGKNAEVTRLNY
jgi:2,3-bisphosphoglycerate-dependent phosphoglycerate mutase